MVHRANATSIKKGQVLNPKGGPRKTVPASKLPLITKMAADGARERHIALALGMSVPTWIRCKKDFPEVADALALGQELLYDKIIGRLIEQAKTNVIAGIYLSKVLFGLREGEPPSDSRPQITINLPGALSLAQFRGAAIEAEAAPALPAPTTITTKVRRG